MLYVYRNTDLLTLRAYCIQETYFAVTNTFEGALFVSASASTNGTLTAYVEELFPLLSKSQVSSVVKAYTDIGLDGTLNQAIGVMGECTCIYS